MFFAVTSRPLETLISSICNIFTSLDAIFSHQPGLRKADFPCHLQKLKPAKSLTPNWSNYDEITSRDKASLDIFWLRDESLEDSANLPDPHVLAAEIAEDLESALEQVTAILVDLEERSRK